jgi:hypothetical protein
LAACATAPAYQPIDAGPKPVIILPTRREPSDQQVAVPFETAWQRAVTFFTDTHLPIQTIDKSSGLIIVARSPLPYKLLQQWLDCGTTNGEPTLAHNIASGLQVSASMGITMLARPGAQSTTVRVSTDVTAEVSAVGMSVPLRCVSNGTIENGVVAYIAAPA